MRLKTQILLLITPLIVIPLLTLGWIAHNHLRHTSEQRTLDQMEVLLDQVSLNIESEIDAAEFIIKTISKLSLVQQYALTASELDRYAIIQPSLLRLLASFQKTNPDYYEMRILMPDGYEDLRSTIKRIPNITEEEAETPYFKELSNSAQDIYTTYIINPDNNEPALIVGKALRFGNKTVDAITDSTVLRGYLVVTIKPQYSSQQTTSYLFGKKGVLFFTDNQGRILYHPDGPAQKQLPAPFLKKLKSPTEEQLTWSANLFGEQVYINSRKLHKNLFVVGSLPKKEVLEAGQQLGMLIVAITALSIILTLTTLYFFLNRILIKPIQLLNNAANQIAGGNLTNDIQIKTQGEIGDLAYTFNHMRENLRLSNDKIRHLAYHDPLTGLPNRRMLHEYLSHTMAYCRRRQLFMAVLLLDIDDFKRINDALGHQAGDNLLNAVSKLLKECLRSEDLVVVNVDEPPDTGSQFMARIGGDEFVILLPDIKTPHDVQIVARRILQLLSEPIQIANHQLYLTASIGITIFPSDAEDEESLMKNSDIAMYKAKADGKNSFRFYSHTMNEAANQRIHMENKLRTALSQEKLSLHYQPIVDISAGRTAGFEALLRWQDPELGFVSPEVFIPIAEETGLILPIGEWVLKQACTQLKSWHNQGHDDLFVSINVSNVQVARSDLVTIVRTHLSDTALSPESVHLELTESSFVIEKGRTSDTLKKLQDLGVYISLDDFGTGYSSLARLRNLPINVLKIDRMFINNMFKSKEDAAIVSAIIAMGRSMDIHVLAEGIETQEQYDSLAQKGCDMVQGYLISRPIPASEVPGFIAAQLTSVA